MSDPLREYIESTRAPLSADAQRFLAALDGGERLEGASLEVDDELFSTEKPKFVFKTQKQEWRLQWSERLNGALLEREVRLSRLEDEAARVGLHLLDNLRYPDIRFGADYTSSVFAEYCRERFGDVKAVRDSLDLAPVNAPYKEGSYVDCRDYVRSAVDGLGNSLVIQLKYSDGEAWRILVAGIWYLLEKRFSLAFLRAVKGL